MIIKFQITKVAAIFVMATTFMFFTGCKSQQKAITTATPQPTLINEEAKDWAKVHTTELIGKYMATAGNKIDPDEMRLLFTPIGYDGGSNTIYYRDAERYLVDTLYSVMLERAVKQGKTQFVIFTGPSASGKSTAAKEMDFSETGLVYDAAFNSYKKLATAIKKAKRYGMKEIRLIAVYNTIRNCFKNSVERGKKSKRFIHIPYMIAALSASMPLFAMTPLTKRGYRRFNRTSPMWSSSVSTRATTLSPGMSPSTRRRNGTSRSRRTT